MDYVIAKKTDDSIPPIIAGQRYKILNIYNGMVTLLVDGVEVIIDISDTDFKIVLHDD